MKRIFCATLVASAVLLSHANAALIEIAFAGSTDTAEGTIEYAPGGTFSGSFVFDTNLAFPNITNPGACC